MLAEWECGSATLRALVYILIHNTRWYLLTFFFLQPSLWAPVILSKMSLMISCLLFFLIPSLSTHLFIRHPSFPFFQWKLSVFIWFFPIDHSGPLLGLTWLWIWFSLFFPQTLTTPPSTIKKKKLVTGQIPLVGFAMWITFPPFPPQILWCLLKFAGYSFFFFFPFHQQLINQPGNLGPI